jgi:predicted transcriptional regulator
MSEEKFDILGATVDIVSAHVSNNSVAIGDIAGFIRSVHASLEALQNGSASEPVSAPVPAVSVRNSVRPNYIVCLEDGKKMQMLKRYLRTHFDMSPEEYRAKWGLPSDYPMVAPAYSAKRKDLALKIGLGKNGARRGGRKPGPKTKK